MLTLMQKSEKMKFEPGTFSTEVRCPYPYTTDSLENLAEKIKEVIQWQKAANI